MELYQLQYFVEVARNRNFTRAGKRLNLATPALSLQIKKLEQELGTRLFNRGQKETLLTPAGEMLFQKAQALLTMADSVKQSVVEVSELRAGRLTIAFIPSVGAHWLPGILKDFCGRFPCLDLRTHEENSQGVAALIEDATAELGFLELPTNNALFEVSEIWNEPFYAVLPREHCLANKKYINLRELEKDSFIVKRGDSRQQTIEACRTAAFESRIACECTEQETMIAMVQAGMGVLLLPQLDACILRDGVVAVPIREPKLVREVGLIHRRSKELSSAARAFVDFVKQRRFPVPSKEGLPIITSSTIVATDSPLQESMAERVAPEGLLSPQKFLERSARVFPNKSAVRFEDQSWTYAEFHQRVNRLASALRKAGLEPGERVAVICPNTPPLLEAHYGVALAGGILVPLNVRFTAGEIAYILNHSKARFLFVDSEFNSAVQPLLGTLGSVKQVVDILDCRKATACGQIHYEEFLATGTPNKVASLLRDEEELLSLNYTSGTTGKPKGVMIAHRGAYLNAIGQVIEGRLNPDSRYLWTLPMFHCNGWCYTWAVTAVAGTHICLRKFDPQHVWQLIDTERITHLSGSPNMFAALLDSPERPKAVKQPLVFGMGGSQPSPTLIARSHELGIRVIHGYGLTETYGPCTICEPQPEWRNLSTREEAKLLARQGVPSIMGDSVRVVDQEMRDIRFDGRSIGEVVMRGATVMKGYYKEPEATARDFHGGWFHSGDLAVVHPDGYIELRDRLREIIVVGGDNVSSSEVEQTLLLHPAVADVAVVGVPHERWGETPKAFVVIKPGAQVKGRELIDFCRQHLAVFKCPSSIDFINSLPKTSSGKTQKFLLREREWIGEEKRIHPI